MQLVLDLIIRICLYAVFFKFLGILICEYTASCRYSFATSLASLKSTFNALINEEYSICVDINRYQSAFEHVLSKSGFLNRYRHIYILPSNLSLNIEKTAGYNNKILVSNTDMKTGSNRNINRVEVYHKKFRLAASPEIHSMKSLDQPIIQTILPTQTIKKCLLKNIMMKN